MSIADPIPRPLTAEALIDRPDDGVHRELIRGELREQPMTARNHVHSTIEAQVARLLGNWLDTQPRPRGRIVCGEAGFRLSRDPETLVGIDVAYASAELVAATGRRPGFFDGPPVLAVEILSPSDRHEQVVEKVGLYLEVGTIVWVIDPDFQTVAIHRPGRVVQLHNEKDELDGGPELPGFRLALALLFS